MGISCLRLFACVALASIGSLHSQVPSWVPGKPSTDSDLSWREKFAVLSEQQRTAVGLHIIQTWGREARREVFDLSEVTGWSMGSSFVLWAQTDFEAALQRAEEWDGFAGNLLRVAIIRDLAVKDPVEAARRMRALMDPMSRSYYYYVTIKSLVPGLVKQPVSVILQAMHEMRTDIAFMDDFRWGDAMDYLLADEKSWVPADPAEDWAWLISQPQSLARDHLLCAVLRAWLRKDPAKAVTAQVPPLHGYMIKHRLERFFPKDPALACNLLPVGEFVLMRSWVKQLQAAPNSVDLKSWASHWAEKAATPKGARALDTVMRIWAEGDEPAALAWAQQLSAGSARDLALEACRESEIRRFAVAEWKKALPLASSLPPGARRDRCLEAVFAGMGAEEFAIVEQQLAALLDPPRDPAPLRDAWRLARQGYFLGRRQHVEGYACLLELENPQLRGMKAATEFSGMTYAQLDETTRLIQQSALSPQEREACLVQMILHALDGGPQDPGPAERLKLSLRLADPEMRFVHQRALLRSVAEEDLDQARKLLEGSPLTKEEKARLQLDLQRLSTWYRRPSKKAGD